MSKSTCLGCKYFDKCGDMERKAPCSGYDMSYARIKAYNKTLATAYELFNDALENGTRYHARTVVSAFVDFSVGLITSNLMTSEEISNIMGQLTTFLEYSNGVVDAVFVEE